MDIEVLRLEALRLAAGYPVPGSQEQIVDRAARYLVFLEGKHETKAEPPVPAVPIEESVTPEWLYSLETGEKFKMLRRHLKQRGMTPETYRVKWGLPPDYPMTAPNYSDVRRVRAKESGLGRWRRKAAE